MKLNPDDDVRVAHATARVEFNALGPDAHAHEHWLALGQALGVVCPCGLPTRAGGLCATHYRRLYKVRTRNEAANVKAAS